LQALPRVAFLSVEHLRLTALRHRLIQRNFSGLARHLLDRRTELNFTVREAARLLGAGNGTYCRCENGEAEPSFEHWPGIIEFLGLDPVCECPETLAEQIAYTCRHLGLDRKALAGHLGVARHTIRAWELGK
jgi:DNA-binding XRE family transcriptional regulator